MDKHAQEKLAALVKLFEEQGLEELLLEEGEFKLHLRRAPSPVAPPAPAHGNPGPAAPPRPHSEPLLENISRTVAVRAPLIGMFYRSASPESPPFVNIGDIVKEGQTVCIVEAMKVYNEIKSDWAGRVKDVPAEHGSLVQAGDPLIVLEFLDGR
jgi:acetyl-CoA carboxylase biotin carboxyl carrier protein